MLSDTCFEIVDRALTDIAWYATQDAFDDYEDRWYDHCAYDDALRRLTPIADMQRALDLGWDPQPMTKEVEDKLVWELVEQLMSHVPEAMDKLIKAGLPIARPTI